MNPENRWIKMADMIPWDVFEKKYKHLFKSKTGNVAKPLRMAPWCTDYTDQIPVFRQRTRAADNGTGNSDQSCGEK